MGTIIRSFLSIFFLIYKDSRFRIDLIFKFVASIIQFSVNSIETLFLISKSSILSQYTTTFSACTYK